MAEWRYGSSWSEKELEERLERLKSASPNFPWEGPESQEGTNWHRYYSESEVGAEKAGRPVKGGAFEIAWDATSKYLFSDPGIVVGHFNPNDPLEGRNMLLEIKIFGLHYLCGVRVGAVRQVSNKKETVYGFRYDTLEGHMEVGSEWFLLTKNHESGKVLFRISASWRPGIFPNWWSRVGFQLFSRRYQLAWHRLAYLRLREIVGYRGQNIAPVPRGEKLVHTGPEIMHSDLWVLKQPSPAIRVQQAASRKE